MWEKESSEEDMFSSIDKASAGGQRLPYLVEGQYLLEVEVIRAFRSRNKDSFYIVEFLILQSDVEERPVGLRASWMTKMNSDMGPVNIKRFLGAAVGLTVVEEIDREVTSDVARFSASDEQPMTGVQVHCQCTKITTKVEKKEFTEHQFAPVAGHTYGDLQPAGEAAAEPALN